MLTKARKQLRSWMFIYAGLVAAILLAGSPAKDNPKSGLETRPFPAIADAPLMRRDI